MNTAAPRNDAADAAGVSEAARAAFKVCIFHSILFFGFIAFCIAAIPEVKNIFEQAKIAPPFLTRLVLNCSEHRHFVLFAWLMFIVADAGIVYRLRKRDWKDGKILSRLYVVLSTLALLAAMGIAAMSVRIQLWIVPTG